MRTIALGTFIAFALAGCGTGKDSDSAGTTGTTTGSTTTGTTGGGTTSTFSVVVDWTDDGNSPTDTDGDGLPDTGCGDSVTITITDPLNAQNWDFGMAETASTNGWTGEDCLNGYGSFNICHPIGLTATLDEVSDCSANSVVAGQTTLLDAEKDPFTTYYLSDMSECFVFGDDPSYYASLGCTTLN